MAESPNENNNGRAPWDPKPDPSNRKRLKRLLPWLGVAALAALVVWGLRDKPTEVETGVVARSPLTVSVSEEGKTRIRNRYVVSSPVAGTMRRVPFKAGDKVVADETVLTAVAPSEAPLLDPRTRAEAEAAVAAAEAARQRAAETLEIARSAARLAAADRDRMRAITRKGTLSESDRDRLEAEATMRAADERAAEFALQVAEHELARARAVLDRPVAGAGNPPVEVRSPVSGVILNVMQESETPVTPGMPILEVGDPSDIEIEAEILSRDAVAIRPGDRAMIEQWGGESDLEARVRRVEPAAFTKISALGVEEQRVIVLCDLVDPPEAAQALGDRYRVEVRIATWQSEDVLVVPSGALFRQGNVWKTFLKQGGRAVLTTVEAGHTDGRHTEVLGGLEAGDEVLVHPPDTVADGSEVVVREG